jgi:hypothetical protein
MRVLRGHAADSRQETLEKCMAAGALHEVVALRRPKSPAKAA